MMRDKGGEIVDNAILMASSAEDIDFMIHGIFSYEIFGHTVWITTTHVCILIVMLTLLVFAFAVNRKMKHATDVPDTFQNIAGITDMFTVFFWQCVHLLSIRYFLTNLSSQLDSALCQKQ